ncbi:uncharacterized protein Pyn_14642 [Prunus yedoensis var. nudiflora]|uniref:Uncharacterized protein n=1 Tax=Prunus yedoensis var. nudiflora TaxID=2094558 RepID=A0A314Z2V5_PRUYE|nr:uncharacterized protein Pyn_14642 [Prunus yedoensis var. nudiflora]
MGLLSWWKGKDTKPETKPNPAPKPVEAPGMNGAVEVPRPVECLDPPTSRSLNSGRSPLPPTRSLSPDTAPFPKTSSPAAGRSSQPVAPTRPSFVWCSEQLGKLL